MPLNAPLPGVGIVVQVFVERDLGFLKQEQIIRSPSYSDCFQVALKPR